MNDVKLVRQEDHIVQISVELYGTFRVGRFTTEHMTFPLHTTVNQIFSTLGIPDSEVGLIVVNSVYAKNDQELVQGDTLALFPLLSGG